MLRLLLQPGQGERIAPVYAAIKGTLNRPMAGPHHTVPFEGRLTPKGINVPRGLASLTNLLGPDLSGAASDRKATANTTIGR